MSPASAPNSITVGASTDTDAMASMSNIGSCLSLFAPGAYQRGWLDDRVTDCTANGCSAPHTGSANACQHHRRCCQPAAAWARPHRASMAFCQWHDLSQTSFTLDSVYSGLTIATVILL